MHIRALPFLLLVLTSFYPVYGQEDTTPIAVLHKYALPFSVSSPDFAYFYDTDGKADIDSIRRMEFSREESALPTPGADTPGTIWVKFKIQSRFKELRDFVFSFGRRYEKPVRIYLYHERTLLEEGSADRYYRINSFEYRANHTVYVSSLEPDIVHEVFLGIRAVEAFKPSIVVQTFTEHYVSQFDDHLVLVILYLGGMIAIFLYNAVVLAIHPNRSSILLCLTYFFYLVYLFADFTYFWAIMLPVQLKPFVDHASSIGTVYGIAALMGYMLVTLDIGSNLPRSGKIFRIAMVILLAASPFIILFQENPSVNFFNTLLKTGLMLFMLYVLLILVARKQPNTWYFLAAWGIFIISSLVSLSTDFMAQTSWLARNIGNMSGIFPAILLALPVGTQIKKLQLDRIKILQEKQVLEELNKAMGLFLSTTAHEIRTPLSLVSGPIQDIISGKFGGTITITNPLLGIIHSNIQHMVRSFENVLSFSRLESQGLPDDAMDIRVLHELAIIQHQYQYEIQQNSLCVVIDPDPGKVHEDYCIRFNPTLFHIMVSNLLNNAIKYTQAGGKILIVVKAEGDWMRLSIEDSGPGIDPDRLQEIFKPYIRLQDGAASRKGFGIGLALVKKILDLHSLTLDVKSEIGTGTTFTVRMPIKERVIIHREPRVAGWESGTAAGSLETGKQEGNAGCILFVEDNEDLQLYYRDRFSQGYEVHLASDGQEALKVLLGNRIMPDLIVSDIAMPGMGGYELLESIKSREELKHIPLLFVTAFGGDERKLESLVGGALDFITKPFDPQELEYKIRNLIALRSDGKKPNQGSEAARESLYSTYKVSKREKEIIACVLNGYSHKDIAGIFHISPKTVSRHVENIYRKLSINSRNELYQLFLSV